MTIAEMNELTRDDLIAIDGIVYEVAKWGFKQVTP